MDKYFLFFHHQYSTTVRQFICLHDSKFLKCKSKQLESRFKHIKLPGQMFVQALVAKPSRRGSLVNNKDCKIAALFITGLNKSKKLNLPVNDDFISCFIIAINNSYKVNTGRQPAYINSLYKVCQP